MNRFIAIVLTIVFTMSLGGWAQENGGGLRTTTGLHYYAFEDLYSRSVIRRGIAGSNGVAFDQLILAPNRRVRIWLLQAETLNVDDVTLTTPDSGERFEIPPFILHEDVTPDSDGDELHDLGEFILGTFADNPDTDGDRIRDGIEVRQGLDPFIDPNNGFLFSIEAPSPEIIENLNNRVLVDELRSAFTANDIDLSDDVSLFVRQAGQEWPLADQGEIYVIRFENDTLSVFNQNNIDPIARTGIIGSADTPGTAVDVAAFNDIVVVADSDRGIAVFNIFNAMDPLIIAQVNTPGNAQAVALAGNLIAVADGPQGLAIVDVSDPPAATIVRQINFSSDARAVASDGRIAYVGLGSGVVAVVDLVNEFVLQQLPISNQRIEDISINGDYIYVLVQGTLFVTTFPSGELTVVGSVASPGAVNAWLGRMRLFVGGNTAYPVHSAGYNTIDISNPEQPSLFSNGTTGQTGWKQIVVNGTGLGLAAVGSRQFSNGDNHVRVYDVSDPENNNNFRPPIRTPGEARAVTIYNGIGYVADDQEGLQVVNYLSFDTGGEKPDIVISTNQASEDVEEGKRVRVTAEVSDKVQVRNVEFYMDETLLATDGNFPFEVFFMAPILTEMDTFTLRARASDTGGNFRWAEELMFTVTADATPPEVLRVQPGNDGILGPVSTLVVNFSEPLNEATLSTASFQLLSYGADGMLETEDDSVVEGGTVSYEARFNVGFLRFEDDLPPGIYQGTLTTSITDLAGNAFPEDFTWSFLIFGDSDTDSDGDGVPNAVEIWLGLNPEEEDSDGNGVNDGDEDFDSDGLSNAGEIILGTDLRSADTDGDGINDGDEDSDRDGLSDGDEVTRGTDPFNVDTDDDGWHDGAEVEAESNPDDEDSLPDLFFAAGISPTVYVPGNNDETGINTNTFLANTAPTVYVPGNNDETGSDTSVFVADPPVVVELPE